MNCIYCQGKTERGTAPFHLDRKGCHLTLDHVPVWVCRQCGEADFEEREVQLIEELLDTVDEKAEQMSASR